MWTSRRTDKAAHLLTGENAEQQAAEYLKQQGLRIIARNYRCKAGEIDLLAKDHDQLVFVEVRFRKQSRFGSAAETVTWQKQQKLQRAAQYYLQQQGLVERVACRFDVVTVQPGASNQAAIDWIRNAF